MNKNVMIVLAGGFVIAILVAVLVQASLGGKKEDTSSKTQVLVASKDLMIGDELKEGDLKWQTWPGNAFAGAIVRKKEDEKAADALKGRLVQRVSSGQPVLGSYIFKEGKGNLVAATLSSGMRAVAIPVKADTMAGGFVSPGDYVDVILTYAVTTESRDNPSVQALVSKNASETIIQNVKVVAVDQEATREEDKAKVARTVTLEVTTAGSERLALAASMGDITLALRGIGDDKTSEKNSMTTDVQVSRVMQDVARIQSESNGPTGKVRIYNGATVQEIQVRNGGAASADAETGVEKAMDESNTGTGVNIKINR